MKLLVYTACYKRSETFRLFLDNQNYLYDCGFDISVACIGDAGNGHIFQEYGDPFDLYVRYKNLPLGEKWNIGLEFIKDLEWDYVLISGSDDLYSPELYARYFQLMEEGVHFAGLIDFYFLDQTKGHLKYFPGHRSERRGETNGAGRILHRSVLEALEWTLWDDHKNQELDLSMTRRLKTVEGLTERVINLKAEGLVAVDIKDGQNIHAIDAYKGQYVSKDVLKDIFQTV